MKRFEPRFASRKEILASMNNDTRLDDAVALIHATDREKTDAWLKYSKHTINKEKGSYNWTGNSQSGYWIDVGKIAGMPICVSIMFTDCDGEVMMIWHTTSQAVYYPIITDFFKMLRPDINSFDADQFSDALNYATQRAASKRSAERIRNNARMREIYHQGSNTHERPQTLERLMHWFYWDLLWSDLKNVYTVCIVKPWRIISKASE